MKKILYIILAAAALVACNADRINDSFGSSYNSANGYSLIDGYMQDIAEMVAYNLKVMETAIIYDSNEELKDLYNKSGKSVWEDGCSFTMSDGKVRDIKISKVDGKNSWTMEFDGDYRIGEYSYRTIYTITANLLNRASGKSGHYDWNAVVSGSRIEREGYKSEFSSTGGLTFTRGTNSNFWDNCDGSMRMEVLRSGKTVDIMMIVFRGSTSDYSVTHFPAPGE